MKQYCRYCANCVQVDEDVCYCEKSRETFWGDKAKRVNKCKDFVFNEIDVFDLDRTYKPIESRRKAKKSAGIQENFLKE